MGFETTASGKYSTAMGVGTIASGKYSTAMGYKTAASGGTSTAMGDLTTASGAGSTAMGTKTTAYGDFSTAMGLGSQALAENSLAGGGGEVTAYAVNSFAYGVGAKATLADSVALGSGAVADRAAGVTGHHFGTGAAPTGAAWKSTKNSISIGSATATRQITGVAAGSEDTDAVNVAQLKQAINFVGTGGTGADIYTQTASLSGSTITFTRTDNTTYAVDLSSISGSGSSASLKFAGDDVAEITKTSGQKLTITGGADTTKLSDNNIGVISDNGDLKIKLSKEIKGITSITTESGAKIDENGINAGNRKITGVADGVNDTDAVNMRQLKAMGITDINGLRRDINNLDDKISKAGAHAAALSALHAQDFDPDARWSIAAGYGNYSGKNAVAVGAFYRPNEKVTMSIGGTLGGGEKMTNAGVSLKIGKSSPCSGLSRAALVNTIEKQNKKIEYQDYEIKDMKIQMQEIIKELETLKTK